MTVRVYIDDDANAIALQKRMNETLAEIPDEDVKNVQMSTHSTSVGVVHVGRITYQIDDE